MQVCDETSGLESLFEGVTVKPAVLHGDLWSGNIGGCQGQPCIYDPATYYGHHEAEWGMSWCASLGPSFWKGYRELIPEEPGFAQRRILYELYHKVRIPFLIALKSVVPFDKVYSVLDCFCIPIYLMVFECGSSIITTFLAAATTTMPAH